EGVVTVHLKRTSAISGEAWASLQRTADTAAKGSGKKEVTVQGTGEGETTMKITSETPVILAYQVARVRFVTTHLGGGGPTDVELTTLPASDAAPMRQAAGNQPAQPWALLTIASGRYPALPGYFTQEWNAASADLVEQALSPYRPSLTRSLRSTS